MKNSTPSLYGAFALALVNATIIGLSFLFAKIAVTTAVKSSGTMAGTIDTLAFRFLIAFTVFVVFSLILGKPVRFGFKKMLGLLPLAICYPIAFFTFQAYGLLYATTVEAGILTATSPILTALIAAVAIKEKTNLKQYAMIFLSVAGVIYITVKTSGSEGVTTSGNLLGIVLIMLSCCSSAGYAVINRVAIRSYRTSEITFYLMAVGVVFFVPLSIGTHLVQGTLSQIFVPLQDKWFCGSILFLAVFSSLLTTIIASIALKRLPAAQLGTFLNLSTVVAIVAGWLFMKESVYFYHILGTAMILAGVIGVNYFGDTKGKS